tara:strand:- start:1296 stop:2207 length:912 start_codon:yes stop_codon:yes gene_type:complete
MRNLSTKGLSMSQAQSISNLCNQNAQEIQRELDSYNNATKSITIDKVQYTLQEGIVIPDDILDKLKNKGDLHACQAFLMEAIKGKESELERLRLISPSLLHLVAPIRAYAPDYDILDNEEESWGWAQLSDSEYSEYLQAEAMASHLGQFIHRNGKLTQLRKELPNTASIEWFEVKDGEKTPVRITKHHHSQSLMQLHEDIAEEHRVYEQRVNYFKAKVKNLVSDQNAHIQKLNADNAAEFLKIEKQFNEEFRIAQDAYNGEILRLTMDFNSNRELLIKRAAGLRISVDPRFQNVIDLFITPEN